MNEKVVGIAFRTSHTIDPQIATGITLKTLHQYPSIGTFLQVEMARILKAEGYKYQLFGGTENEEQYKFKKDFLLPGGMVNVHYSYKVYGADLGKVFLMAFWK